MPELDEPTPGTTDEPKPDDAAKGGAAASEDSPAGGSASEEPSSEDRIAELERKNKQLLSEKTKFEETQRENEQLKRERAAPHPPATGDAEGRAKLQEDLRLEREVVMGIVPTVEHVQAMARLGIWRDMKSQDAVRNTERRVEVVRLPADLQEEAEKLADEEGISVKLAARLHKAERAANGKVAAAADDDERIQRLTAKRDATPATTSRAQGADESRMTRAEYNRRLDKLRENDDMQGAAELVRKKNERKIRVSD